VLQSGEAQIGEDVIPVGGERRIFLARKSPWRSKEGEILGILAITRDITQLKRQQAELSAARDAAQAANRAKSAFLANMSHELRTPLNAVIGFSELIEQAIHGAHADARYRDYAGHVLTGGRHLLRLINEILDLSKIEAEQMVLAEAPVDLGAMIGEAVRLLGPRAAAAGVTLGCDLARDLPACRGDELRLKQVLLNLLSNAIKFTPSGGSARIAAGLDGEGRLVVTVADTGIGIAEADMARLFRPFSQLADAYSRPAEGSGLGLVIARRLVDLHGGELRLDSAPGQGTRAVVVLPATRVLAPAEAA
jgi:signal transduction histidine kinase